MYRVKVARSNLYVLFAAHTRARVSVYALLSLWCWTNFIFCRVYNLS